MKEFPLLGRTLGNSILRKNEGGRIVQWERLNCPTAVMGFPGHTSGKEPTCKFWRQKTCRFDPWVRKIPWKKARQPTPVFLPGESHGQRNLTGYSQWGREQSDTMKQLSIHARTDSMHKVSKDSDLF